MAPKRQPHDAPTEQQAKIGDAIKDATTPLMVNDALNKLARRQGTERVREAVRAWLAYIDGVTTIDGPADGS